MCAGEWYWPLCRDCTTDCGESFVQKKCVSGYDRSALIRWLYICTFGECCGALLRDRYGDGNEWTRSELSGYSGSFAWSWKTCHSKGNTKQTGQADTGWIPADEDPFDPFVPAAFEALEYFGAYQADGTSSSWKCRWKRIPTGADGRWTVTLRKNCTCGGCVWCADIKTSV